MSIVPCPMSTASKKRKRKSNRGCTLPNPLLLKLAEACNQHKHSHLEDETEDHHHPNNDDDSPSDRCRQDLHAMRRILLRVEGQYQRKDSPEDGGGVDECFQDIENLCMLYRSIAADVFCPYSMKLLFQDGKEGIESTFLCVFESILNQLNYKCQLIHNSFFSQRSLLLRSFTSSSSSSLPPFLRCSLA